MGEQYLKSGMSCQEKDLALTFFISDARHNVTSIF